MLLRSPQYGLKSPCCRILTRQQFTVLFCFLFLHLFKLAVYPTPVPCPEISKVQNSTQEVSLEISYARDIAFSYHRYYPEFRPKIYCWILLQYSQSKVFGLGSSMSSFVIKRRNFSLRLPPTYLLVVVVILKHHILKLCTKTGHTYSGNLCLSFPFLSPDFSFPLEDSQFIHRCP